MKSVLLTIALALSATTVYAQTNPVPVSQPFTVAFDHDGLNVAGFQCYIDGNPSGALLPATSRGCAIPGLATGSHTIGVAAVNMFGTASSPSFTVTAGSPPSAPSNLRLSMTIAVKPDGSVELLAFNVEKQ